MAKKDISVEIKTKKSPLLVPTGATLLDLVIGGGYPFGKIINVVGDTSSGKTYLAIECIAAAKKRYGDKLKIFYDDAESGFSFDTQSMYGYSILPENGYKSLVIEEFASNLKVQLDKIKDDEYLIYVLDTFDAVGSYAEMNRDKERQAAFAEGKVYDKGSYKMEKQKFAGEFFRLRANEIETKNCLLIIISQVRMKIDAMFGEKYSRSGGKALDFYAYVNLWLSETEKHKKKSRPVSITIKAKTKKAKIKRPYRECFVDVVFDYGIDDIKSNLNYLYDLKTDTGRDKTGYSRQKLDWEDGEFVVEKLITHIEENNLEEELAQKVKDKWNAIEDSIASNRKKRY